MMLMILKWVGTLLNSILAHEAAWENICIIEWMAECNGEVWKHLPHVTSGRAVQ